MSTVEILEELPKLSPEEREKIRLKLAELNREEWMDDGELTDEEKRLIDARLDACERQPGSFMAWEEAKAKILASVRK